MNKDMVRRYTRGTELNSDHLTVLKALSQNQTMRRLKGASLSTLSNRSVSASIVETLLDLNYITSKLQFSGRQIFTVYTITGRGLDFLTVFDR